LKLGGVPLLELCQSFARDAQIPVAVHLDHCDNPDYIRTALNVGLRSVMADGSSLEYEQNVAFTSQMAKLAHVNGSVIEGELGRISGYEDGMSVSLVRGTMTNPQQAIDFVARTRIDSLAVCIGNVHGEYAVEPTLDFGLLRMLQKSINVPLVLHGSSGLPERIVQRAIELGVCKFNVNTEVRQAYVNSLSKFSREKKEQTFDLPELMEHAISAMSDVVSGKLKLFGSSRRA